MIVINSLFNDRAAISKRYLILEFTQEILSFVASSVSQQINPMFVTFDSLVELTLFEYI